MTAKNEEIRQVDIELANLNRKLDALKRFKASMDNMNDDIDTLAAKIDGIGHIWGSVRFFSNPPGSPLYTRS